LLVAVNHSTRQLAVAVEAVEVAVAVTAVEVVEEALADYSLFADKRG